MRPAMFALIHRTHLGIVKCKQRARDELYWPGMSAQNRRQSKRLYHVPQRHYLVLVDYYSKYIEVTKLNDLTSQDTTEALKEHFSRHGIPAKLVTDYGVQYTSKEFETFARSYNFEHVLASPKHPRSKITMEEKQRQEQSTSRVQSNPNPRDQPLSVSTLLGT